MDDKQEPQFMELKNVGKRFATRGFHVSDTESFLKSLSPDNASMAILAAILDQLQKLNAPKERIHDIHPVSYGISCSLADFDQNDIRCAVNECDSNWSDAPSFVRAAMWDSTRFVANDWRLDRIPTGLMKSYLGNTWNLFDLWERREGTDTYETKKDFCKWRAAVRRRRRERKRRSQVSAE